MKRIGSVILVIMLLLSISQPVYAISLVDEGVTFYEHINYGGNHTKLLIEGDYTLADLEKYGFVDNWTSSVNIPFDYTVQLFKDDGLVNTNYNVDQWLLTIPNDENSRNFCNFLDGDGNNEVNSLSGGNDKVSSVRVRKGVTLYENSEYNGSCTAGLMPGYYTLDDLKNWGFKNDWASSVSIPYGWYVKLFENDDFGGRMWRIDQIDKNSTNFNNFDGNDKVSSIQVFDGSYTIEDLMEGDGYKYVNRQEWGAKDFKRENEGSNFSNTAHPYYDTIVIHHTQRNANESINKLQEDIQDGGMFEEGGGDIDYHYVIARDATIYEGRPISIRGEHVKGGNTHKIGIVLMGNYHDTYSWKDELQGALPIQPTQKQIDALYYLVKELKGLYPINEVGLHKYYNDTECPGKYLIDAIKNNGKILTR